MTEGGPLAKRLLGSTGLQVSPICLGTSALGDMPDTYKFSVNRERALSTIRAALTSDINFIDTAASYGLGESERRIGAVLKEMGGIPDGYVVATKADRDLETNEFSGSQTRKSVEQSLALLGVDRLQLVYLHDPEYCDWDDLTGRGGAIETLQAFKDDGVIEHLGLAGGPIDVMMRCLKEADFEAIISHNRYTLINRAADPLFDYAHSRGIAVVNASPYGSGILAKGVDEYPRYAYQDASDEIVGMVRRIEGICAAYGVPLAAASLQFSLRDSRISSTIVGATRPERIQQNIDLAQVDVPDEMWVELDAVSDWTEDPEAHRDYKPR